MKPVRTLLALTLLALGLDVWLVAGDHALDVLTPPPEKVASTFVTALGAHRFDVARASLAEELRTASSPVRLARLDRTLDGAWGRYRPTPDSHERWAGERVELEMTLLTQHAGRVRPVLTLERDPRSRLWKITSLDGLAGTALRASRAPAPAAPTSPHLPGSHRPMPG